MLTDEHTQIAQDFLIAADSENSPRGMSFRVRRSYGARRPTRSWRSLSGETCFMGATVR